jgi:hypothetical protein
MPNIGMYAPPAKGLDKSWLSVLAYSFMEREWKPGLAGARRGRGSATMLHGKLYSPNFLPKRRLGALIYSKKQSWDGS